MTISRQVFRVLAFNALSMIVIFIAFSFVIRAYLAWGVQGNVSSASKTYNSNTIRATYPNYNHLTAKDAKAIFDGFAGPSSSYVSFTEWRRNPYTSGAVNVESEFRTRLSFGHSQQESIWFLGGSTMWGTGATDDTTIPSYFSKLTGEKVWNFGESGYNSFQNLIQLQKMLARGYQPKAVVFYDGVNDSHYCNANVKKLPTHTRYDRYKKYIRGYRSLEKRLKKAEADLRKKRKHQSIDVGGTLNKPFYFIVRPYRTLYDNYFDKRAIGLSTNKNLSVGKKFSEFNRKKHYKICGEDTARATAAATTTVEAWLMAYDILKSRGIISYFVLQPSAHIKPESLQLDYLLDAEKQMIADERASYARRYQATRQIWNTKCRLYNACDKFLDLSEALVGFEEPVFIDAMHLSGNGNELIAKKISEFVQIN